MFGEDPSGVPHDRAPTPAETAAPIVVLAQDVTLRHGAHTVLDGLTLRVPAGAVVGLVGRNGAGKSSLLRCLVGLAVPQAGGVMLLADRAWRKVDLGFLTGSGAVHSLHAGGPS